MDLLFFFEGEEGYFLKDFWILRMSVKLNQRDSGGFSAVVLHPRAACRHRT